MQESEPKFKIVGEIDGVPIKRYGRSAHGKRRMKGTRHTASPINSNSPVERIEELEDLQLRFGQNQARQRKIDYWKQRWINLTIHHRKQQRKSQKQREREGFADFRPPSPGGDSRSHRTSLERDVSAYVTENGQSGPPPMELEKSALR